MRLAYSALSPHPLLPGNSRRRSPCCTDTRVLHAACAPWVLQTSLQYSYAQRLYDGRGITFGFCGFTTGTDDGLMVRCWAAAGPPHAWGRPRWLVAYCPPKPSTQRLRSAIDLQVVQEYTRRKPNNPLARFLPALRRVRGRGDSFSGLNGFERVVQSLGNDPGELGGWSWRWALCMARRLAARLLAMRQRIWLRVSFRQPSGTAGDPGRCRGVCLMVLLHCCRLHCGPVGSERL